MTTRKIQLVAGSTYTISMPKSWIGRNRLKAGDEVSISESSDGSVIISPGTGPQERLSEITISADERGEGVGEALFAPYYLGVEGIKVTSKEPMSRETRAAIRGAVARMSGTEISFEDDRTMEIRVLLDRSKIDFRQVLYRMGLIIDMSMANACGRNEAEESEMNEREADRLYHLAMKVLSMSLADSVVLKSSGITNLSFVPQYVLIAKKLENIGDVLVTLSPILRKSRRGELANSRKALEFLRGEAKRSMSHASKMPHGAFAKAGAAEVEEVNGMISACGDPRVRECLNDILRLIIDIEESVVDLSFFRKLSG
jgi:phosphate uptake regulator